MNNSNEQQFQTDPAQLHQGVARIERAFGDLAARFVASNERVQRALLQQQEFQNLQFGEIAGLAQQNAGERGHTTEASASAEQAQRDEEAQMAEIQAWADAHRDVPVEEESDPFEAHKKIWLDVVDPEPVK